MTKPFKPGDAVRWNTSQGETRGRIVRKITSPRRIKGHKVAAAPDNPEYVVKTDTSGKTAAHKPGALKKT